MYRTGLMRPRLALLGVIGGPLIFLSSIAVLLDANEQRPSRPLLAARGPPSRRRLRSPRLSSASGPYRSSPAHQRNGRFEQVGEHRPRFRFEACCFESGCR
jgi:hypothetical protein